MKTVLKLATGTRTREALAALHRAEIARELQLDLPEPERVEAWVRDQFGGRARLEHRGDRGFEIVLVIGAGETPTDAWQEAECGPARQAIDAALTIMDLAEEIEG